VGTGMPTRNGKARFYTPSRPISFGLPTEQIRGSKDESRTRPFHASSPHVQRNKTGILCARFYNQRIRGQHVDRLILRHA
jgi:hypothetical protein